MAKIREERIEWPVVTTGLPSYRFIYVYLFPFIGEVAIPLIGEIIIFKSIQSWKAAKLGPTYSLIVDQDTL